MMHIAFNLLRGFDQWNHFTFLKPKSDQLRRPITAVLAAASMIGILPLEFIVKVPDHSQERFSVLKASADVANGAFDKPVS